MKIIDIPEAIEINMGMSPEGEVKGMHTLLEVVEKALDLHEPLGKGLENIRKAIKIHGKVEKTKKSGEKVLRLEDDEYNTVKAAFESASWAPRFARQIGPFLDAVMDAQDVQDHAKK